MNSRVTEKDLRPAIKRLFPARRYHRQHEVPMGAKVIDFCAVPKDDPEKATAVELKVENWRRALWQAITYQLVFPLSYVAIWHRNLHRVDQDLVRQAGIGLISATKSKARIVIQAKRSRRHHKEALLNIAETIRGKTL